MRQPTHCRPPTYLYLHGFASGPSSTKARFFAERLAEHGQAVLVPDLNGEDFSNLTISSQLAIIDRTLASSETAEPLVVVGSSMGGLLATLLARRRTDVKALVLLAPGFSLPERWLSLLGEAGVEDWRIRGYTEVFHYGLNRQARLSYAFITDALAYQTSGLRVGIPAIVFHGRHDETVPFAESVRFCNLNRPLARLHAVEDGHELIAPLQGIWQETSRFLGDLGLLAGKR